MHERLTNSLEKVKDYHLTRRGFLKLLGGSLVAATIPEAALEIYRQSVIADRLSRQPKFLSAPPSYPIFKGTYPHDHNYEKVQQWDKAIGSKANIVGLFLNKNTTDHIVTISNLAASHGRLPLISWGSKLTASLEDQKIQYLALANKLKEVESPFLFRPWFEMNGTWATSWFGAFTPKQFQESWMLLRDTFDAEKVPAALVFNPNVTTPHLGAWGRDIKPYYVPGYVDFLALDVYNKHSIYRTNPRHYSFLNFSPEVELGPDFKTFQEIAPGVPILQGEVNAAIENGRSDWILRAINYGIESGSRAWITFDWNKINVNYDEADWSIIDAPRVVEAVKNEVQKPYYFKEESSTPEQIMHLLQAA